MSSNTGRIRYHSADDMMGLGELAEVTEPAAVVIRPDGSVDVYGYMAVIDQRGAQASYSLSDVREGTGWPRGARFVVAGA